jgi:hypothetical protein
VLEVGRYIPAFHTELLFAPKFNTGTYQYIGLLHPFVFFQFLKVYPYALRNTLALLHFHFEDCVQGNFWQGIERQDPEAVQEVSRWLFTTETRVRARVSPYEICDG